jgi:D-lactate dehydrogenase
MLHGKLEIEYTNQALNEDTAKLAEGFEGRTKTQRHQ